VHHPVARCAMSSGMTTRGFKGILAAAACLRARCAMRVLSEGGERLLTLNACGPATATDVEAWKGGIFLCAVRDFGLQCAAAGGGTLLRAQGIRLQAAEALIFVSVRRFSKLRADIGETWHLASLPDSSATLVRSACQSRMALRHDSGCNVRRSIRSWRPSRVRHLQRELT
jgi:hypothetical protein